MPKKKAKGKGTGGRPRLTRWSVSYASCRACGTDSRHSTNQHHARGYCYRCYHRIKAAQRAPVKSA